MIVYNNMLTQERTPKSLWLEGWYISKQWRWLWHRGKGDASKDCRADWCSPGRCCCGYLLIHPNGRGSIRSRRGRPQRDCPQRDCPSPRSMEGWRKVIVPSIPSEPAVEIPIDRLGAIDVYSRTAWCQWWNVYRWYLVFIERISYWICFLLSHHIQIGFLHT